MESRHEGSARVHRFILLAGLVALGAWPARAQQPQPGAIPLGRRAAGPSAYDGYAVPAEVLAGKAAEWLAGEATAAAALPVEQRHVKRVDRLLSAAVAAKLAGGGPAAADWGTKAYGAGSPAAKAFTGFGELLGGKADHLMALAAVLAGENLQGGWRDLALGLRQAAGDAKVGPATSPQAIMGLYVLGLPYPGGSRDKDNSAIAAMRVFAGAPAEVQKAIVDAVLKGKAEPACQEYVRRLPDFLESMFRNRQTECPELGRLMIALTDDPGRRSTRTAMLPASMGPARDEALKEAAKQTATTHASPWRRLGAAEDLVRQGEVKAAYEAYAQLETILPEDGRHLAWCGQFRALAAAAKKGADAGTTVAAEKAKRSQSAAAQPGPATQVALADLEYLAGDKAAALAAYERLIAATDTPPYLCVPMWGRLADEAPARAWALVKPLEAALVRPDPRAGNTPETVLVFVGLAMGQPAGTADILARLRPQRAKTWQVGNEAALRCLAGQNEMAATLLQGLDDINSGSTELIQFTAMAVEPRAPATASEGPLRKAAATGMAKCPPTPEAWALAARTVVRLLQTKNSDNSGLGLWGDLMRRFPVQPKAEDRQVAGELGRALVESTQANRTKDPSQFVNLLDATGQPLHSPGGLGCLPHAIELLATGLRESKAVGMTERQAEGAIKRFCAGMQQCKAPAEAYATLRHAVTAAYPNLAAAVTVPEK